MSNGVLRKTMVYLGLSPEPEEYDDLPEHFGMEPTSDGGLHHAGSPPAEDDDRDSNVRPLRAGQPTPRSSDMPVRVALVEVHDFEDAEHIGSRYRSGRPVLFDLSRVETALGRRVLDFVSGITYALRGRLEVAGDRAFILLPNGVELPDDEWRRLRELGYGGQ